MVAYFLLRICYSTAYEGIHPETVSYIPAIKNKPIPIYNSRNLLAGTS